MAVVLGICHYFPALTKAQDSQIRLLTKLSAPLAHAQEKPEIFFHYLCACGVETLASPPKHSIVSLKLSDGFQMAFRGFLGPSDPANFAPSTH